MASFTDRNGLEWEVGEIDNLDVEAIDQECGLDLLDEFDSNRLNKSLFELVSTDVWLKVLTYLLREQLAARNMTASQIRLTASLSRIAREVVLDAFADFFQGRSTLLFLQFAELRKGTATAIVERMLASRAKLLQTMDLSALNSADLASLESAMSAGVAALPKREPGSTDSAAK
jgi:hypothetical protein